jgi:hypothetical protein
MTFQPTLDLHPENHLHFAQNTDSKGCCCFWKSKSKPKEYYVNEKLEIQPKKCNYRQRIIANQRLAELIMLNFDNDPIENDKAFERLKLKINDPMNNGDKITPDKLAKIITAIAELKAEFSSPDLRLNQDENAGMHH